ncbi:MAG TPA: hypothetical protein ENN56_01020 [Firmicutes bacterium]|nr:hypothetical protein [Bacillota bacterium]
MNPLRFRWFSLAAMIVAAVSSVRAGDYGLLFSHDLNVWSWDQSIGWDRVFGDKLVVTANGSHTRKVSESSAYDQRSDFATGNLRFNYSVTPQWSLGSEFTIDQSRLTAGAVRSDVISRRAELDSRYELYPGVQVRGAAGAAYEERRDVAHAGFAWRVGATAYPFRHVRLGDRANIVVTFDRDAVESPQGDAQTSFAVQGGMRWTPWLDQTVQYSENHDAQRYVSAFDGGRILLRVNHSRKVRTELDGVYPLVGLVELEGEYRWGDVQDDASNDSTSLKYRTDNTTHSLSGGVTWHIPLERPNLTYRVTSSRSTRDAVPVVKSDSLVLRNDLDRHRNDLGMSLASVFAFGRTDSLTLSGSLAISRDHTPAETEVNDRDDFTRTFVALYHHGFRSGTTLQLRAERIETHQVWLNRARSANNRWDRALNLWATTRAPLGIITFTQRAFFKAQLEEFDFDYLTPDRPRSRNARIGRLDFIGEFSLPGDGLATAEYTIEARTRGVLLPADRPGERPTLWQLTRNELAQVVTVDLGVPIGERWTFSPEVSVSRQLDFIPTQTAWNPFRLGRQVDKQEALYLEATALYRPDGDLGAFSVRAARTYRRRGAITDTRDFVSVTWQYAF